MIRPLLFSLLLALLSSPLTLLADPFSEERERTLRYSMKIKYQTFDPLYSTTSRGTLLHSLMFQGLTSEDERSRTIPGQAESWEISDDGLTYTFHLRKNLRWSDGEPLKASDFVYQFKRLHDPKWNEHRKRTESAVMILNSTAVLKGDLPLDKLGVYASDDRTLLIRLEFPRTGFLSKLAGSAFSPVPVHLIEKYGEDWDELKHIAVNGPYLPIEWQNKSAVRLVRNPLYHSTNRLTFHRIELLHPKASTRGQLEALLKGEIDIIEKFSILKGTDVKNSPFFYPAIQDAIIYLTLNVNNPELSDRRVRLALSMAMNREEIIITKGTAYTPVYTLYPSIQSMDWEAQNPAWVDWPYEQRLIEARNLMEQAGYGPNKRLNLELLGASKSTTQRLLRKHWQAIWVDLRITAVNPPAFYQRLSKGDYQLARRGHNYTREQKTDFTWEMLAYPHKRNYSGWNDQEYMATLKKLRAIKTPLSIAERNSYYRSLEQRILSELPIIPIYVFSATSVVSNRIRQLPGKGQSFKIYNLQLAK